jgi:hypothetical protein
MKYYISQDVTVHRWHATKASETSVNLNGIGSG